MCYSRVWMAHTNQQVRHVLFNKNDNSSLLNIRPMGKKDCSGLRSFLSPGCVLHQPCILLDCAVERSLISQSQSQNLRKQGGATALQPTLCEAHIPTDEARPLRRASRPSLRHLINQQKPRTPQDLLSFSFNLHPCDSSGLPSSALWTASESHISNVCLRRTENIPYWIVTIF